MNLIVGNIVELKIPVLGNDVGTKGVVYETYPDFDVTGDAASVIFSNGEYDGFSVDDQESFFTKLPSIEDDNNHRNYQFNNVLLVSYDFENGFWNTVLKNKII